MVLTATIKSKIKVPKLDFSQTLLDVANRDIISRLAKNIQQGIDLKERPYDNLDSKTIKAKGHSRPLIETGKLHSSFIAKILGKNRVIINIKAVRIKIAEYLQLTGIKTKRGKRFFNFFGVNTRMEKDGIKRMEKEIKKRIKDAGR